MKVDPFADTGDHDSQPSHYVHIRSNSYVHSVWFLVQQRNGRKTLTTVQGVPTEYDQKRILRALKKDFACNGTIVKDEEMGEVIQLQGDQRVKVMEFLSTQLNIQKKKIKVWSL